MDFTDVSFSKELAANDDDLVEQNVAEMLIFPEDQNQLSLAPNDLNKLDPDEIKLETIQNPKHNEAIHDNEYFIIDNKHKNHDDGETSSIHNTNNNSFNFSNIFNQMNESAANQSGLMLQAFSQGPGFSEEKLMQMKQQQLLEHHKNDDILHLE